LCISNEVIFRISLICRLTWIPENFGSNKYHQVGLDQIGRAISKQITEYWNTAEYRDPLIAFSQCLFD